MSQDIDSNNPKYARASTETDDGHVRQPRDISILKLIQSSGQTRIRRHDWCSSNK
jgi:hypothetical protein